MRDAEVAMEKTGKPVLIERNGKPVWLMAPVTWLDIVSPRTSDEKQEASEEK